MDPHEHGTVDPRGATGHPAATLLRAQALGLLVAAAACLGAGATVTAGLAGVLAAVAAGLATSVAEGFPGCGPAIVVFEGVALTVLVAPMTLPGAAAVLAVTTGGWGVAHHRHQAQIRRPVSCQ